MHTCKVVLSLYTLTALVTVWVASMIENEQNSNSVANGRVRHDREELENVQQSQNGWIAPSTLDELLQRQFAIVVLVHSFEYLIGSFDGVFFQLQHVAHHFVHGLRDKGDESDNSRRSGCDYVENFQHLRPTDESIVVDIVDVEGQLYFW